MPSFNEITGARISSGAHKENTDYEKFSSGWDAIFSKKQKEGLVKLDVQRLDEALKAPLFKFHKD